jgi:PBS lyase HEAT-like repeat
VRPGLAAALLGTALAAAPGCDDQSYREIGREISVLTTRNDALVPRARERLAHFGRRAIPQIETALHTASDNGRANLIAALGQIGDGEAIPVLRHFAVYDLSAQVRARCEELLGSWATATPPDRAESARLALARVRTLREKGEAPTPARP